MEEFQECIEDLEVHDHHFVGPIFTWSNKQEGAYLARKLDRILINSQWLLEFPESFVEYKAPGVSDHCLGIIWTQKGTRAHMPKPFKFFNCWTDSEDYLSSVMSSWQACTRGNHIQLSNLVNADHLGVEEERKIQADLVGLEIAELEFFRQKTKAHWLQEGDLSTKYFHQKVESRKKINTIRVIKNDDGQFLETFDGMDLLSYSLPTGADRVLIGEVSDKEIHEALFMQGKDNSPGPDDYTSWFFKSAWEIVRKHFLSVVRSITDNNLLAQEIVKGYSRKNLSPRYAIKIDLKKAFDSINWEFLLNVLGAVGLPSRFSDWIKTCVTTPSYSIALNDSLVGYFKGVRGVRQGDPLSPYLFVLVMNVLSRLLDAAARSGIFKYHPRCKRISLTHLCFADDLLMFCYGSLDSMLGVVSVLNKFYEMSGLMLNASKTEMYACGVNDGVLEQIKRATRFRIDQFPVRYLGVPLVTRKLSRTDCSALMRKLGTS
ncbi:uncharacterized protein LOC120161430 [Hibiscus syriacus]|uniref:uncharacterized protein LOC120161430 n=1 Tax=Hibiscus syriacus TaxID=106335 RepID=UPI001920A767|nr:uncharacterized protein LOC120161430 [Hibiscus syriacus]